MKKLLLIASISLLLGCSAQPTQVTPDAYENPSHRLLVNKVPLTITKPPAVQWRSVQFTVINNEIASRMITNKQDISYIAITSHDYTNLSLNTADLVRYIEAQNTIIEHMIEYYQPTPP